MCSSVTHACFAWFCEAEIQLSGLVRMPQMQGRIATLLQDAPEATMKTPSFHGAVNSVLSDMAHPEHVQWAPEFAAALVAFEQHTPYPQTMIQAVCLDQWTTYMHRFAPFIFCSENEPPIFPRCPACTSKDFPCS